MNDKVKFFEDLDTLVRMSRSKSDGPSLRLEEEEIVDKIESIKLDIEEAKANSEEEIYDTSAEMADRNIEIITKKLLQSLKIELKNQNSDLDKEKELEKDKSDMLQALKSSRRSLENYIATMQERILDSTDRSINDRYNSIIREAEEKIENITHDINTNEREYETIQNHITGITKEIETTKEKISRKQEQLKETQYNLENKEVYVNKSRRDKNKRKIQELVDEKNKLTNRLEEIHTDPKYLEYVIREKYNKNEEAFEYRNSIIELVKKASEQPFMDAQADNSLEEELLKATQARDSFANQIDQKSYNLIELESPEQIRIDFLNERIKKWNSNLNELEERIKEIDLDNQFNYKEKNNSVSALIDKIKEELADYQEAYDEESENNISAKASLKAALDEKKLDLREAEKIASSFRKDEAEDISYASTLLKVDCEKINKQINLAEEEIKEIKNRLLNKKSGMIDIRSQKQDKEKLRELANVVVDIKHRRQFAEQPIAIAQRMEKYLNIDIVSALDKKYRDTAIQKVVEEPLEEIVEQPEKQEEKRGIKVITETEITPLEKKEETFEEPVDEPNVELEKNVIEEQDEITISAEPSEEIEQNTVVEEEQTIVEQPEEQSVVEDESEQIELHPIEEVVNKEQEDELIELIPSQEEDEEKIEEIPVNSSPTEENTSNLTENSDIIVPNSDLAKELDQFLNNLAEEEAK